MSTARDRVAFRKKTVRRQHAAMQRLVGAQARERIAQLEQLVTDQQNRIAELEKEKNMSAHARLSASSAHRWLNCAGSVNASADLPDSTSAHAAAGTFAHHIAAACLSDAEEPGNWLGNKTVIDGHVVECDQEMVDAVGVYLEAIRQDTSAFSQGTQNWTEMPLLKVLQGIDPDLGGTGDFVRYSTTTKHLRVFDFKFGRGVYVEADENEQMMLYALGAMLVVDKPMTDVTVTIVQPRYEAAAPVRDYHFKAVDILEFIADVKAAAGETRRPDAPLAAGDWCQFCKAARTCPELEKKQHALVASEFSSIVAYDPVKLAAALAAIPLVKQRIAAIEEFAYAEASRGMEVPGFKLVDKRASRSWKSDGDVIEWAQKNALDPYAKPELLSPAQMEKLAGKVTKLPPELVESKSSGTVLVPVSDKRPPAKRITVDDFSIVGG